jgi:hypothetical protein
MVTKTLAALSLLALAGCASTSKDSPDQLLTKLDKFVMTDLDSAIAVAQAHNDPMAAQCFLTIRQLVGTATPTAEQVKGVVSAWETARATRLSLQSGAASPLKAACAPIMLDEREFIARLLLMFGH